MSFQRRVSPPEEMGTVIRGQYGQEEIQKPSERSRQLIENKRSVFWEAVNLLKTGQINVLSRQVSENEPLSVLSSDVLRRGGVAPQEIARTKRPNDRVPGEMEKAKSKTLRTKPLYH